MTRLPIKVIFYLVLMELNHGSFGVLRTVLKLSVGVLLWINEQKSRILDD